MYVLRIQKQGFWFVCDVLNLKKQNLLSSVILLGKIILKEGSIDEVQPISGNYSC